ETRQGVLDVAREARPDGEEARATADSPFRAPAELQKILVDPLAGAVLDKAIDLRAGLSPNHPVTPGIDLRAPFPRLRLIHHEHAASKTTPVLRCAQMSDLSRQVIRFHAGHVRRASS